MARREAILRGAAAASAAAALTLVAGCGGNARQDAGEDAATYPVSIVAASFPAHQTLAQPTELRITVENIGDHAIPNLAVTIEGEGEGTQVAAFGTADAAAGLASSSRPVWVIDDGPGDGDTAYANTWAAGPLPAHHRATLTWHVAAVRAGHYVLTYRLAGSLTGKSQLRRKDGGIPGATFKVDIDPAPGKTIVTDDGKVKRVSG